MHKSRAVIIIPTYNELENIKKLIPRLSEVFETIKNWDMHVLVVDDSSPDGTALEVKEIAKKRTNVHLLVNPKKAGLGHAYLSGMKEAFGKLDADVVFEFDADFSHDASKIPEFLAQMDSGSDMVLGSRYIPGGGIPEDWGLYRQFLSVVGNLFIVVVFTDPRIRDWTGGYRAIRRKVYEAVKDEMSDPKFSGYTFQVGFLRKAVVKGFKVSEVPFKFVDRKVGKSKMGTETITNTLVFVVMTRINEIINSRVFKFAVVGGTGFVINTLALFILSRLPAVQHLAIWLEQISHFSFINASGTASAIGAEIAIVSNFIWNNLWTFADRKITNPWMILPKFLQFNLSSFGAVLIQFLVVGAGTHFTGEGSISRLVWLVTATAIGMVLNFIIYSKIIWKSDKKSVTK